MKRLTILTVVMLSLLAGVTFAEFPGISKWGAIGGGFGYTGFMVTYSDTSTLNSFLKANGYSAIDNFDYSFGGGGGSVINNFYIGGSGFGSILSQTSDNASGNTYLKRETGGGGLEFGYVLLHLKNYLFLPIAGYTWGSTTYKVYNTTATSTDFQTLLTQPGNMSEIKNSKFSLNVALLNIIMFRGMGLYVKLGYSFTPVSTWSLDGYSGHITNTPQESPHSVFISAGLLFGGMKSTKEYNVKVEKK